MDKSDAAWPKRMTLYAYTSPEHNMRQAVRLGLTGEALVVFGAFEQVELEAEIAETGEVTVVTCQGKRCGG